MPLVFILKNIAEFYLRFILYIIFYGYSMQTNYHICRQHVMIGITNQNHNFYCNYLIYINFLIQSFDF